MNISDNKNRIQVLNDRLDKLIYLNQRYHYTTMLSGKIANPRAEQYTRLLLAIHKEKVGLWVFNRENNKIYQQNLENAKTSVSKMLLRNTKPNFKI